MHNHLLVISRIDASFPQGLVALYDNTVMINKYVYISMRATKVLWLLHLHLEDPEHHSPAENSIRTFLYSKKCEIKLPGCWEGILAGKWGKERVGGGLHSPGHLYQL